MKVLRTVVPSPEQLIVVNDHKPGTTLIKGAAGSGKTTTALLRLKQAQRFWLRRARDGHVDGAVRILVLTYNKTLRGYINALVLEQVDQSKTTIEVRTFGKWSYGKVRPRRFLDVNEAKPRLTSLGSTMGLPTNFLLDEIEYVTGRFLPGEIEDYALPTTRRTGRGLAPRMDQAMRRRLLDEVILPFNEWKQNRDRMDWNDVAAELHEHPVGRPYHVVIVDEAQDFSANQIRAVQSHLAPEFSQTFVLDAAQRIYPRSFRWSEAGVKINTTYSLGQNFRNTAAIARFAAPLIDGLDLGDDGTLPDFSTCSTPGATPTVVQGSFSRQMDYLISDVQAILSTAPFLDDPPSIGILHALGGGWFDEVKRRLDAAGLAFVPIAKEDEWPEGPECIALSTMHSAKGLEFDHVYIVGLNAAATPHGSEAGDSLLETYQRLLAMAIGRAKVSVMISYKAAEASSLIGLLDPATFNHIDL